MAEVLDARFVRKAILPALVQEVAASAPSVVIDRQVLIEQQKASGQRRNEDHMALNDGFHRTFA